jgi:hypothetical protein
MTTSDEEMSEEERKTAERVLHGLQVMREMGLLRPKQDDDKLTDKTPTREITQRERLQAFLDSFLKWVLVPIGKILKITMAALWAVFGPLFLGITIIVIAFMLFFVWIFVAYEIAWWIADETVSRVLLLLFLVLAPIGYFANSNVWALLSLREWAQAKHTADLLGKTLKDKKNE